MRDYEAMFLLEPELGDAGVTAFVETIGGLLGENEGELTATGQLLDRKGQVSEASESWSKRRLAYPIKGHLEGYYVVLNFKSGPDAVEALERAVRFDEKVIRHLVLRQDAA